MFFGSGDTESIYMTDLFRQHITCGRIGIFTELSDNLYNRVQLKFIEIFDTRIKFVSCSHNARNNENELYEYKEITK